MYHRVNGFNDIYTVLANERKVGGAIEAKKIRLRTGEEYSLPVVTNIDFAGSQFYSISFVSDDNRRMIVNVSDVSMIDEPEHKKLYEIKNRYFKTDKIKEKIQYLKRLCEVNEGACTKLFVKEVKEIVDDISIEEAEKQLDLDFLNEHRDVIRIA